MKVAFIPQLSVVLLLTLLHCFIVSAFSTDKIQIITTEEEFLDGLGDRIQKWGMNDTSFNYETVAIMGSQSSGKSTVLNNIFGTDFAVMDPKEQKRTTNGIWLSRDGVQNIIVMDVEGSDSNTRKDDQNFERKSALFSLICSKVLIVNIWQHQVGLYTGANLGLLSIIFEEYLALFGNSDRRIYDRPQIIFIIQAHSGTISLESLSQTLTRDLMGIWERVNKPEELRDQSVTDYFDFKFDSLPHLVLDSDHYNHRVKSLRRRFVDQSSKDYIFKNTYSTIVSVDGLENYMRATWEKIRLNEKLNLPGQHELIARVMCDKISASLLEEYRSHIASKLSSLDNGEILEDLHSTMQSWKDVILGRYDKDAGHYVQHVFVEKRISLIQSFHVEISKLFDKQLKNVRHSLLANFDKELEDAMGKEDEEFASFVSEARVKYENRFGEAVKNVAIDEAEWEWKDELEELRNGMTEKVKARERARVTPLEVTRTQSVGYKKTMTTTATLYRNGKLFVHISTSSRDNFHGLRGRVVIVLRDADGEAIGVTDTIRCTTRGGDLFDFLGTPSSGVDVFTLEFPRDVARRAVGLDIWQAGDNSVNDILSQILKIAKGAVEIARFIRI